MTKLEYLIKAINSEAMLYREWYICLLSTTQRLDDPVGDFPYRLRYVEEFCEYLDESGNWTRIDDYVLDESDPKGLFHVKDHVTLPAGSMVNQPKELVTTVGNMIANAVLLIYPFGNKIEYVNKRFSVKWVEEIIEQRLVSEFAPEDSANNKPDVIYIDEKHRYNESTDLLESVMWLFVPAATRRSIEIPEGMIELRDKLLEKYKGRLNDPVVQANIDAELVEFYKGTLEGDRSEGFTIKDKTFSVVKKKLFMLQGSSGAFGEKNDFIPTALFEGIKPEHFIHNVNTLRAGSHDRGSETAKGGELVNLVLRITQNFAITEDDCGSTLYIERVLTESELKENFGIYVKGSKGLVAVDKDNYKSLAGKVLKMRDPSTCKTEGDGYCVKCMGESFRNQPESLPMAASNPASTVMYAFMRSMHGGKVSTAKLDWRNTMT